MDQAISLNSPHQVKMLEITLPAGPDQQPSIDMCVPRNVILYTNGPGNLFILIRITISKKLLINFFISCYSRRCNTRWVTPQIIISVRKTVMIIIFKFIVITSVLQQFSSSKKKKIVEYIVY